MKLILRIFTSFDKRRITGILSVIVFIFVLMALSTHNAYAQDISGVAKLFGWDLSSLISESLANFFYTLQTIASWLIVITGSLLNFSINLTMHIKDFVDATPAIYTVWKAIRDISGIFIIFSLLYAAIMLITGVRSPGFSGLIKNIVIAGVLINFSFFITGLAIDASNIVSLQLYNAIAPSQDNTLFSQKNPLNKLLEASTGRVGLANVFMQSLGITRLYNPDGGLSTAGKAAAGSLSAPLKIIVIGVTSIIIMITAALSFFLASIAFVVRFVILLFLLAFSPIVFASFVIPSSDLGTYAKKWTGLLKSQLIFMPVYLLLMYFALSVLTQSSIFKNGYAGPLVAGGAWYSDLLAIAVNAVLVIIMMNVPLIAAMAIGGKMPKWAESVTAGAVWKKFGGAVGGIAGRNTLGWAASGLDKSIDKSRFAGGLVARAGNSIIGRDLRAATLGAATKAKFGSSRSYEDEAELQKKVAKKDKEIKRGLEFHNTLATDIQNARAGIPPVIGPDGRPINVGTTMTKMSEKERLALGADTLKDPMVVKHLKRSDFEAIAKSDDFSVEDQKDIADARRTALIEAAKSGEADTVKFMLGNMSDDDKRTMAKTREEALDEAVNRTPVTGSKTLENIVNSMTGKELMSLANITRPEVIAYLKNSQLKEMSDESIDDSKKKVIGRTIKNWSTGFTRYSAGRDHKALSFVNENRNHHWWN